MKKRECPSCALEIVEHNGTCPICNYEFPVKSGMNYKFIALGLVFLMTSQLVRIFC